MISEQFLGLYNYWIVIVLMMTGFYIVIARQNMIKTIIGLNIFQTSVFLLYITMGKIRGGTAPIIPPHRVAEHGHESGHDGHPVADHAGHGADHGHEVVDHSHDAASELAEHLPDAAADQAVAATGDAVAAVIYSNPLPSVLMLTAIVVGIATTALALALIVRIREDYGSIEEDEILLLDRKS